MNWWVFGVVVVGIAALGYLGQRFGLFDLVGRNTSKSSGSGSGIIGIGDEVFAPSRHEAQVELDRQTILPAPAPVAGDGDKGIGVDLSTDPATGPYDGVVKIDLTQLPLSQLPSRQLHLSQLHLSQLPLSQLHLSQLPLSQVQKDAE